jgi:hypothetical protein
MEFQKSTNTGDTMKYREAWGLHKYSDTPRRNSTMYESKKMKNLIEAVKRVMNTKEAAGTPFSAAELKAIEDATKAMIDHSTDPKKPTSYDFFDFRQLKKYVNKDYPEVSYDFEKRGKGTAQVLWGRDGNKFTCSYSVGIGNSDMDTMDFEGRNPQDCFNQYRRNFKEIKWGPDHPEWEQERRAKR